jgi:soluble lytic murein transglycosylase-like protein
MYLGAVSACAAEPDTVGLQPPQAVSNRKTNPDPAPNSRTAGHSDAGALDGILAVTDEHGRKVYVNAAPASPAKRTQPAPAPQHVQNPRPPDSPSRQTSVLVYWNSSQNRWQTVPPPTAPAMKAARSAASDVAGLLGQQLSATSGSSAPNPQSRATTTPGFGVVDWKQIDAAIEQAAARHNVDPNLVRAMIKVESNFNPWAVSRKGAMGLMQLMPETARHLNVSHPFDPQENVDAGVRHLRRLLDNFGGDVRLSLAAYNAGETAVTQHAGIPNFTETRNYVKQITSRYWTGIPPLHNATTLRVFRDTNGILTIRSD